MKLETRCRLFLLADLDALPSAFALHADLLAVLGDGEAPKRQAGVLSLLYLDALNVRYSRPRRERRWQRFINALEKTLRSRGGDVTAPAFQRLGAIIWENTDLRKQFRDREPHALAV